MVTTDQDARALTYLARRLRSETHGCREWDDAGTFAVIAAELVGKQLAHALEMVLRHAVDPDARTPGAIRRPFTPPKPSEQSTLNHPPKAGQDCPRHPGQWADRCGGCLADQRAADGTDTPPRSWEPAESNSAALARAAYAQSRANLCSHGVPRLNCADHRNAPIEPAEPNEPTEETR